MVFTVVMMTNNTSDDKAIAGLSQAVETWIRKHV